MALKLEKYKFIPCLQEGSSLLETAKGASNIASLKSFITRFLLSKINGVFYASGFEEAEKMTKEFYLKKSTKGFKEAEGIDNKSNLVRLSAVNDKITFILFYFLKKKMKKLL